MYLSQAIEGFLLSRDGESKKDLSPTTINLYRNCLALLTDYLHDPELQMITNGDLVSYMNYLEKEYQPKRTGTDKLSGYARDNHWKAIRSFYAWVNKDLKIQRVDDDLPRPAYIEDEIIPYSKEEIKIILNACEYTKVANTDGKKTYKMRRPTAQRDKTIVLLFLETGIRLGELTRLKIEDVNLEVSELHVRPYRTGIKSRPRTIPFGKSCRKSLWLYKTRERSDALRSETFFPMALRTIQSLFVRIEERTNVPDVYAHRFRHTFAVQFLRNGGDVFSLQKILGHTSLKMVRRYLVIAQSDIRDAHRRASPVDRWQL